MTLDSPEDSGLIISPSVDKRVETRKTPPENAIPRVYFEHATDNPLAILRMLTPAFYAELLRKNQTRKSEKSLDTTSDIKPVNFANKKDVEKIIQYFQEYVTAPQINVSDEKLIADRDELTKELKALPWDQFLQITTHSGKIPTPESIAFSYNAQQVLGEFFKVHPELKDPVKAELEKMAKQKIAEDEEGGLAGELIRIYGTVRKALNVLNKILTDKTAVVNSSELLQELQTKLINDSFSSIESLKAFCLMGLQLFYICRKNGTEACVRFKSNSADPEETEVAFRTQHPETNQLLEARLILVPWKDRIGRKSYFIPELDFYKVEIDQKKAKTSFKPINVK